LKTLRGFELLDTAISPNRAVAALPRRRGARAARVRSSVSSARAGLRTSAQCWALIPRRAQGSARSRRCHPHALRILRHRLRVPAREFRVIYCAARCATRRRKRRTASS
jgi:hypothetical protein